MLWIVKMLSFFLPSCKGPEMIPTGKSTFGYLLKERHQYSHINDTHTQVDEWEVAENEIIVLKDQPLGEGCFGQVFKGMLMGKSLQNRPKGNFRPPGFSLTCTVAVKQLKSKYKCPNFFM